MPKYSRLKSCGVQKQGPDHRIVSGVLEDELYAMQCEISVYWPELRIQRIRTRMKRFTTDRCLLAEKFFRNCEGWLIDSELDGKIKKDIGRNGCRHMAILIVDCLHTLVRAELSRELTDSLTQNPQLDRKHFVEDFLKRNPNLSKYLKIN
jgi:hypothetical protein